MLCKLHLNKAVKIDNTKITKEKKSLPSWTLHSRTMLSNRSFRDEEKVLWLPYYGSHQPACHYWVRTWSMASATERLDFYF